MEWGDSRGQVMARRFWGMVLAMGVAGGMVVAGNDSLGMDVPVVGTGGDGGGVTKPMDLFGHADAALKEMDLPGDVWGELLEIHRMAGEELSSIIRQLGGRDDAMERARRTNDVLTRVHAEEVRLLNED